MPINYLTYNILYLENNREAYLARNPVNIVSKIGSVPGISVTCVVWTTKSTSKHLDLCTDVCECILYHYKAGSDCRIECTTEYRRNSSVYRAHPDYRSCGPWNDWCMFSMENSHSLNKKKKKRKVSGTDRSNVLCKLLCFVIDDMHTQLYSAVVHKCTHHVEEHSVITNKWQLEYNDNNMSTPNLLIIPVTSIMSPVFVLECPSSQTGVVYEVKDRSVWSSSFI